MNFERYLQSDPFTILDIGGRYASLPEFRGIEQLCNVVAFEPDQAEAARLEQASETMSYQNYTCFPYALSDVTGDLPIYVTRNPACSSIYPANTPELIGFQSLLSVTETIRKESCPAVRLDDFLQENSVPSIDYVNLDVQGGEIRVIEGGYNTFKEQVLVLWTEVEFTAVYENQPLFRDVDALLSSLGFKLLGFAKIRARKRDNIADCPEALGEVMWSNALYVRRPEFFLSTPASLQRLPKFMLLLEMFKHPGYALHVLDELERMGDIREYETFARDFRHFVDVQYRKDAQPRLTGRLKSIAKTFLRFRN